MRQDTQYKNSMKKTNNITVSHRQLDGNATHPAPDEKDGVQGLVKDKCFSVSAISVICSELDNL